MKKIFICSLYIILNSCNNSEQLNRDSSSISLNRDYTDSFESFISNFVWNRRSVYGDNIDMFLIEDKFSYELTNDFKNIDGYPATVFFNTYDTSRERREMILFDTNMHTFYAVVQDTGYFKSLQMNTDVNMYGRMLGFRMMGDTANPELDEPSFIIYLDSVQILKTHNLFKYKQNLQIDRMKK